MYLIPRSWNNVPNTVSVLGTMYLIPNSVSVDVDGEFLHNVSNGNSYLELGFELNGSDFDEIDNKENDYSNSSKCKAFMLLIISYHNCYIINYFFHPQIIYSSRSTIVECKGK